MVLYGIFLASSEEILWFYQDGARTILPDAWDDFASLIPKSEQQDMLGAYQKLLRSEDSEVQLNAARHWSLWEGRALRLIPDADLIASFSEPDRALAQALIECHYMTNGCFLKRNQLVDGLQQIRNIPTVLVHGRYDLVCPVSTAWKLHKAWLQSSLIIVPDAGHSARELGIQKAIVEAIDKFTLLFNRARLVRCYGTCFRTLD